MKEPEESEIEDLLEFIKNFYGYDLTGYAKASLLRRVVRFLNNYKLTDVKQLIEELTINTAIFGLFLTELTVNVTEMFRDPTFYKSLRQNVLPKLKTYPHIKVWDAGCSTGEEAYSMAIVLKEESLLHKSRIYATDLNLKVLEIARDGIYPLHYLQEYSKNYQKSGGVTSFSEYYLAKYNNAIIDSKLKENIIFAAHNLVSDSTFNEFNLILCRNVLIYFQKDLQEKVLQLFVNSLCMYGYLALGSKETLALSSVRERFEVVDARDKIFRRIA